MKMQRGWKSVECGSGDTMRIPTTTTPTTHKKLESFRIISNERTHFRIIFSAVDLYIFDNLYGNGDSLQSKDNSKWQHIAKLTFLFVKFYQLNYTLYWRTQIEMINSISFCSCFYLFPLMGFHCGTFGSLNIFVELNVSIILVMSFVCHCCVI